MFLDYRLYLISCCLVFFNLGAFAQSTTSNVKEKQEVFIPIATDAYTDSLYFQNLEKSKAETLRLNNPPIIKVSSPLGLKERIKNYEISRDKYFKNSKEYLDIQAKIDRLINELNNTIEPNE
jgi:hypothetical protein